LFTIFGVFRISVSVAGVAGFVGFVGFAGVIGVVVIGVVVIGFVSIPSTPLSSKFSIEVGMNKVITTTAIANTITIAMTYFNKDKKDLRDNFIMCYILSIDIIGLAWCLKR
jgi:hypothetical protein